MQSGEQAEERDRSIAATAAPLASGGSTVSPSLAVVDGKTAYEMKFLVSPGELDRLARWVEARMSLDPHAEAARGNAYRIHTLYLDTPALDIHGRTRFYKGRKYRVRRYGNEPVVYLERKTKRAYVVTKRRVCIPSEDLDRLENGFLDEHWPANWFQERVLARGLRPTCQISYDRVAYVGWNSEGPLRVTWDRGFRCHAQQRFAAGELPAGASLPELAVLELKYRTVLPALFKELIDELRLTPTRTSKYRLAVETLSLANGMKD